MNGDATCPDPDGLDEKARLALALLAQEIADATASAGIQLWAQSVEDRLLDFTDEPAVPLSALEDAELLAIHPILVAAAAACDDRPYRHWVVNLGAMVTGVLQAREAEQMLQDAKFDAVIAEEQRRQRENRAPENLEGLPSWRESSGPADDPNPVIP